MSRRVFFETAQHLPRRKDLIQKLGADCCNRDGVEEKFRDLSQGNSCLATLGWRMQSLWD